MVSLILKNGKVKNVELSSGYVYGRGRFDRLAVRGSSCLVTGYNWTIHYSGLSVVCIVPIFSFCVGRFGNGCYFGGFTNKLEYSGAFNRPALLRWLYGLGLSPVDCAKIADTVFNCL